MINIRDIKAEMNLEVDESITLLLNAIAMEELGLSRIINGAGEELKYVIKTLEERLKEDYGHNLDNEYTEGIKSDLEVFMKVNESINDTMKTVFKSQVFIQMKIESIIEMKRGLKDEGRGKEKIKKGEGREKKRREVKGNKMEVLCEPVFLKGKTL